jgi:hypothetical protein
MCCNDVGTMVLQCARERREVPEAGMRGILTVVALD